MAEAYRFEVSREDVVVDLRPDHSLMHLMGIVCHEWLNDARSGDGGIWDHMWTIAVNGTRYTGPFEQFDGDEDPKEAKLQDLNLFPGAMIDVTYDMGSTTHFAIRFLSIERIAGDVELPRRFQQASETATYEPPAGSPNLNEAFPHANELLFGEGSVAQWIIPFPCSKDCAGCIEAGPNAMSDMVFMPNKCASFKELLVAFNEAGKHSPDSSTRADAFARMTFPQTLAAGDEEKFKAFKGELDEFERYCAANGLGGVVPLSMMGGHPESVMYRLMGPKEAVIRVTDENMKAVEGVDVERAFPECAKAYLDERRLWISYRRGKMDICKGYGSSERGIPRHGSVVATASQLKIRSLHEFFCVAEALFKEVE